MLRRNKLCDRPRLSERERKVADFRIVCTAVRFQFLLCDVIFNFHEDVLFCDERVSTERFRFTFIYKYITLYILLVKYTS